MKDSVINVMRVRMRPQSRVAKGDSTDKEDKGMELMFEKITKIVGILFFGGWILTGTFFYIKAIIDFLI